MKRTCLPAWVAMAACLSFVGGSAFANKGGSLSAGTLQQLLQCSLSYRTSSWYFSPLRSVPLKNRSWGIYQSDLGAMVYAFRVPQCISRIKGDKSVIRLGKGAIARLANLPLYAPQQGTQKNSYRVNYYNPAIFQWVAQNIPGAQDKFLGVAFQEIYKIVFRRLVRITAYTYLHLQQQNFQALVKQYRSTHVASAAFKDRRAMWAHRSKARQYRQQLHLQFRDLIKDPILVGARGRMMYYRYHAGHAAMFWLRRGVGGTEKDVWLLVKTILKEYDPKFLANISGKKLGPVTFKLPKLPPPKVYVLGPSQASELPDILRKASPHSKIRLKSGTYRYSKGLKILNRQQLVLEGFGDGPVRIVVDNRNDDVIEIRNSRDITIKKISAKHANPPKGLTCAGAVISLGRAQRIWIHRSELNGSGAYGIRAWGSRDIIITHNYIHSNSNAALQVSSTRGMYVHHNKIVRNATSLMCTYGCGVIMRDNMIQNNTGSNAASSFLREIQQRDQK